MIWRAAALLVCLSLAPAVAQTPGVPFRIAVIGDEPPGCSAALTATRGAEAYTGHLAARLKQDVVLCAFPTRAAVAAALADGSVDMGWLDPAAYAPVANKVRPILTGREAGTPGRSMAMLLVAASSPGKDLASLSGARVLLADDRTVGRDIPLQALADAGAPTDSFLVEAALPGEEAAAAALRAGRGDALILEASAWQRLCVGDAPDKKPCADLAELWRGRPTARLAIAVSTAMPADRRYQLVGIHVPLHLENPRALAWIAADLPGTGLLDPTEAGALTEKAP